MSDLNKKVETLANARVIALNEEIRITDLTVLNALAKALESQIVAQEALIKDDVSEKEDDVNKKATHKHTTPRNK